MVPPPKPKRSPIKVNYLENQRMLKGGVDESDQFGYKNIKDVKTESS